MSKQSIPLRDRFENLILQTQACQQGPNLFQGHCPSHEDRTPSLSLTLVDDKILIKCHAGCETPQVLGALGWKMADLFEGAEEDVRRDTKSSSGPKQEDLRYRTVSKYAYHQDDGTVRFVVVRREATDASGKKLKKFFQAKINPDGSSTRNMRGVERIPYRLPELLKAIAAKKPVLLLEGEKDVQSAERLGFVATTLPGGTGAKGVVNECLPWLKGADIILCPDNDEAGIAFHQELGKKLSNLAKRVRWLELPGLEIKGDLSDWLERGGTPEALQILVNQAQDFAADDDEYLESDFDIDAVVGDALPLIPRGILPKELENYLELVAEQLDLNYEAAFCELLVNVSIAVGGRKQIKIHQSDQGWREKACLWLASIGISGSGKTPLNRKCGGALLAQQQRSWQALWQQEVDDWERTDDASKPAKPTRKRWIANNITLETLIALHAENPAGLGFVSDEILGILNGLGQFKGGRGNDKQTILSLWNGYDFENPTADSDRYVRDVYVPMSGGIQEVLVRKIINEENTSDGLAARFLFNHLVIAKIPASIERQQEIDFILSESNRGFNAMKEIFDRLASIRDVEHHLLLSEYARNHLALFDQYLKKQAREGSDQIFAAYMKLRTYLYRLTLLVHYMTRASADESEVSEKTALDAINIMRFFVASMQRAYGTVGMNARERKARAILDKLHQLGGRAKPKDIKQPIKKTVSSKEASALIKELVERGVLKEVRDGKEKFVELVNR